MVGTPRERVHLDANNSRGRERLRLQLGEYLRVGDFMIVNQHECFAQTHSCIIEPCRTHVVGIFQCAVSPRTVSPYVMKLTV